MFVVRLTGQWIAWVAALSKPHHGRSSWRLSRVVLGILLALGRRSVSRWWRSAGIGEEFRSERVEWGTR